MNFNFTLIGQLLAFILFVWFCMKYVWPPLLGVLEEREKEIADGLNAASEGRRELEEANVKREEILQDAKKKPLTWSTKQTRGRTNWLRMLRHRHKRRQKE